MSEALCVVCRHREPVRGRVCDEDRHTITTRLEDLVRQTEALELQLLPGQTPAGPRVAQSKVHAPLSVRLDALSLLGPGSTGDAGERRPRVRRWATQEQVDVEARVGTYRVDRHTTTITVWHQELIRDPATGEPLLVADDDQTGVIPPAEWLDQQVRAWRSALGHHVPPRTIVRATPDEDPPAWEKVRTWLMTGPVTGGPYLAACLDLIADAGRLDHARRTLGIHAHEPHADRPDDPVADEWQGRFGNPSPRQAMRWDVRYLVAWLDTVCDDEDDPVDVAGFAAELRSLSAELGRVLGEQPDEQWIGRCPAEITDRATGERKLCGAGIWQDPHASVICCPRCRSSWGPRKVHLIHLGRLIRRTWPLDRRRRYTHPERAAVPPVPCPACTTPVVVVWKDVTATDDDERRWRPAGVACPNNCPDARRVL